MKVKKFKGRVFWAGVVTGGILVTEVTRAILKDDKDFKIDYKENLDFPSGLIVLKSDNGFEFIGKDKIANATLNAKFYSNGGNHILNGIWIENGDRMLCVIELEEVDHFDD